MAHHDPPDRPAQQDDDTEGHAFKWDLVEDPKGGRRLRQGWNPNDPAPGQPQPRKAEPDAEKSRGTR